MYGDTFIWLTTKDHTTKVSGLAVDRRCPGIRH